MELFSDGTTLTTWGGATVAVFLCNDCAALVRADKLQKHVDFHEHLNGVSEKASTAFINSVTP